VLTAWFAHALRRVLAWPAARWPALALAPVLAWLSLAALGLNEAPLTGLGAIAWPAAFVFGYLLLWREQSDAPGRTADALHTVMFWVLCCVLAQQAYWRLRTYVPEGAWSWSAWAYGVGMAVLLVSAVGTRLRWPIGRFARAYQLWAAGPLAKGPGLCHGTGGNGYAFLKLHRRTGDPVWLARARAFAMTAVVQLRGAQAVAGRGRYSLWTGDIGLAIYLWDCITAEPRFPTIDVF